jgi:hypothetical protein
MIVIRLLGVVLVGIVWPSVRWLLWGSSLAVFAVAIPYEAVRAQVRLDIDHQERDAGNQSGGALLRITLPKAGVYLLVGLGYAVRVGTGLSLGAGTPVPVAAMVVVALCISGFGTMFVAMTWVLESSKCIPKLDKWSDYPSNVCDATLARKSHLGPLAKQARLLGDRVSLVHMERDEKGRLKSGVADSIPVLGPRFVTETGERIASRRLLTVWNLAFLLTAGMAGPLGLILANGLVPDPAIGRDTVVFLVGIATAVGLTYATRGFQSLSCLAGGPVLLALVAWKAALSRPLLAAIPLIVVAGTYLSGRKQTYAQLQIEHLREGLRRLTVGLASSVGRLIMGRETTAALLHSNTKDQDKGRDKFSDHVG